MGETTAHFFLSLSKRLSGLQIECLTCKALYVEQISSYVLDNKTTRLCLFLQRNRALLYMSVSLIHPILKLDPYRFVIDYALGSRGSANNGSPGDMAIVHGPSWSEGVIERKFRDHSSVIRCVS